MQALLELRNEAAQTSAIDVCYRSSPLFGDLAATNKGLPAYRNSRIILCHYNYTNILLEVKVNKQNFVLTELKTLGQDIATLAIDVEAELHEQEQALRKAEKEREKEADKGQSLSRLVAVPYNRNRLLPELDYFERRLAAVKTYLRGVEIPL